MDADWVAEAPRYPGGKILVVNFPGVDVGSTIEFEIVRQKKGRLFFSMHDALLTYGDPYDLGPGIFRYREPLVFKRTVVNVPKGLELKVVKADAGIGFGRGLIRDSENVIEETVRPSGADDCLRIYGKKGSAGSAGRRSAPLAQFYTCRAAFRSGSGIRGETGRVRASGQSSGLMTRSAGRSNPLSGTRRSKRIGWWPFAILSPRT